MVEFTLSRPRNGIEFHVISENLSSGFQFWENCLAVGPSRSTRNPWISHSAVKAGILEPFEDKWDLVKSQL